MRPLFRREALDAKASPWIGRVQLVRPLSLDLMTAAVVLAAVGVIAFLVLGHYTRKATVEGVLIPDGGLIRLVPAEAATVIERRVSEGQQVRAGDVLFVLALERARLLGGAQAEVQRSLAERQRSLVESARQQESLAASQQTALDRRLQAIEAERSHIDGEIGLQKQRLALAQQASNRLEALRDEKFISDAQVQAKKEELLGLQAQLQALERQRTALGRERAQIEGERRNLPLLSRGVQGTIERDLAALARESAEQDVERQLIVRAPRDGMISAVLAEPGQAVSPASALASLVPHGAVLLAHLYAPSRAVGFVRPAQAVRLRLEAFPYQKFGHLQGQVLHVSRTPLASGELAALAFSGAASARPGEALFRITVALADPANSQRWPQPLVAGMRLQGDVLLEQRRLIEWLFEPVLGLSDRM